ncbi:hypothetical protein SAMN05421770_101609 [Granulicella rosea]|uniref:Uncharacterized protein n=1 Tax=Granulicella rosea TaxID=474952 RepID=A0A239DRU9_9BACT|nr:hypothetical protein [Granulicella rosea]SNS34929.1 hypothetical protein SAMN05421770_101609 [Granulicella rosea]
MRSLSNLVSEGFIWGVGITRPRQGQEHRAAVYITTTLVLSVAGAVGMFFFLMTHFL